MKIQIFGIPNNVSQEERYTYQDDHLGQMVAVIESEDEDGKLYKITFGKNGNGELYGRFIGEPFKSPQTYFYDPSLQKEWFAEYDENEQMIHYKDSDNVEKFWELDYAAGSYQEVFHEIEMDEEVKENIEHIWENDMINLNEQIITINTILHNMDEVLRIYIETNGETVSEISQALESISGIEQLVISTDNYYKNIEAAEELMK